MEKFWFTQKKYGWGWVPATWQGWVIIVMHILMVLYFSMQINDNSSFSEVLMKFLIPTTAVTVILVLIAYTTGESPSWQWGHKDKVE